jgi:Rod binding domain-containing protein
MLVAAIQPRIDTSHLTPDELANNKRLTKEQKISEASKQFEAIMVRQILTEAQKSSIKNEFNDNSTASSIYKDFVTDQLANSISHSGGIGLAKTFEQQLSQPQKNHGVPGKFLQP